MPILGLDQKVAEWLNALGISGDGVARVVVEIPLDGVVRAYVEHVIDAKGFDIRFNRGEVEIVTVPREKG